MKTPSVIIAVGIMLTIMSCDNPMTIQTKVNEDGSLEKTITFEKTEIGKADRNIFGVNEKAGWRLKRSRPFDSITVKSDKGKYRLQFSKHFENDEQMNKELDTNSDTLFQVHSKFEKKFRWFYTYILYSETIRPINRFKKVSSKDFFTPEDSLFISRLPAEGKTISNADSVYLELLNEKISDHYATMGIFNETFQIMEEVITKNKLDKKWLDTLYAKRDFIYNLLAKDKGDNFSARKIADTLQIPLPKGLADKDFTELSKDFNARLDFMSFARDGKYVNEFEMPWTLIASNADSVAGNKAYWRPLVHKFVYMDYEMFAESRRINWWVVVISVIIVSLTLFVLSRNSKS